MALAWNMHLMGLEPGYCISLLPANGTADGKNGDHIIIAPAYNVTRTDIETIVNRTEKVVRDVFQSMMP
jgi:adenosylmethionine-8-amino-7-oxononanoate aminotransferase